MMGNAEKLTKVNSKLKAYRLNSYLKDIFIYYNEALFSDELPICQLEVSHTKRGFVPSTFRLRKAKTTNTPTIYLHFEYAGIAWRDQHAQFVHDLCHYYCYQYGTSCSFDHYHDKTWADKMESIG